MDTRLHNNRRLWAWMAAVALFLTTLSSQAIWRCLDGTVCPVRCAAVHGERVEPACHAGLATIAATHTCCDATPAMIAATPHLEKAYAPMTCQLGAQTQPAATLAGDAAVFPPLLALPPPLAPVLHAVPAEMAAPVVAYPAPRSFLPNHYLRPYAGRAPPARLA